MKTRICIALLILIVVPTLFSQQGNIKIGIIDSGMSTPFAWPVSSPRDQGLDPEIFERACKEVEKMPFLHSLLVVRHGYLIAERYFYFHHENDAADIGSVAKSIMSALVGIALRENNLVSVEQKMIDSFPEYMYTDMDPDKFDITLKHLLTMSSGYPSVDTDELWDQFLQSDDWLAYGIYLPLVYPVGERWQFSTTSPHLLSGIITKASGMSTREFAEKHLFDPLKISPTNWRQDPKGYYTGGFGMYFTPRDIARFGYLYLQGGMVDGQQIVPLAWIEESLQPYIATARTYPTFEEEGFGFLWHVGRMSEYNVTFAVGEGGQLILNIPELDMLLVTTADAGVTRYDSGKHTESVFELAAYHILYPIRDFLGAAPYSPAEVTGRKVPNRSLLQTEHINIMKWQVNPRNQGENISAYKIYLYSGNNRQLLGRMDAGSLEFRHRGVEEGTRYIYGITSLTPDKGESTPAFVTIQYPDSNS